MQEGISPLLCVVLSLSLCNGGTCALYPVAVATKPWVFCYIPLWCLNPGLQWQGDKAAAEASLVSLPAQGLRHADRLLNPRDPLYQLLSA